MQAIDKHLIEQLKDLIGGDQKALDELIETFLLEGSGIITDMYSALSSRDIELLRRSAHSLKSSAQDFGAREVSTMSATIETFCRMQWPEDAQSLVDAVARDFAIASLELQNLIETSRA
jgi:HPt (histidine-containing phosphotransfer) domain-containing protein